MKAKTASNKNVVIQKDTEYSIDKLSKQPERK